MAFLNSFYQAFVGFISPFASSVNRKRRSPDSDQQQQGTNKRRCAPDSVKKELRFTTQLRTEINNEMSDPEEEGKLSSHHLETRPPALQVAPALGSSVLLPAGQGENIYSFPQPLRNSHGSHESSVARKSKLAQPQQQVWKNVSAFKEVKSISQLEERAWQPGMQDAFQGSIRQETTLFQIKSAGSPLFPTNSYRFQRPSSIVNKGYTMLSQHPKTEKLGEFCHFGRTTVNYQARDQLEQALKEFQNADQIRRRDLLPTNHSIDLTVDDEDHLLQKPSDAHVFRSAFGHAAAIELMEAPGPRQKGQLGTPHRQLDAKMRSLVGGEGIAAEKSATTKTADFEKPYPCDTSTSQEYPFTPSLLAGDMKLRLEQQAPAATASLGHFEHVAFCLQDAEYQRKVAESQAATLRAQVANEKALKAAQQYDWQNEAEEVAKKFQDQLSQLEQEICHRSLRRQAAAEPKDLAAQTIVKGLEKEEDDVVELLTSEEEEDSAQEAYSAAEVMEEEQLRDGLAELVVSGEFFELPRAQYKRYEDALSRTGNLMEQLVMHQRSQIEIRRKDIACMAPLEWLNDEVINLYMSLLLERDMRRRILGVLPKCHFFSTFFANKLYKDTGYSYSNVQKWTMPRQLKRQGQSSESILDCDRVILPVHQGMHWVCAVIDIANKRFIYYDSLKGEDQKCLDSLSKYIAEEYQSKRNQMVDTSTWERAFPKDIPQQQNGCDCGVFTLLFAEHAARDAPMQFAQKHINFFRVKIVNEILNQRID